MQSLEIRDYQVFVNLGWEAEERALKQEVRVSLELQFEAKPAACLSDELSDTVCYRELCKKVKASAESKPYQTVEFLFQAITDAVMAELPKGVKLSLRIHKVKPPIDGLLGGVVFGQK